MLIGFTTKTSKKLSKILCRHFRHCIVLFPDKKNRYILLQIASDGIRAINIGTKEIKILKNSGWEFIDATNKNTKFIFPNYLTCVGFAKRALGIKKPFIWTPDQLYRKLKKLSD